MPSFSETVTAVRDIEAAIASISQAYARVAELLRNVPEPIRSDAVREIVSLARRWADANGANNPSVSLTNPSLFREAKQPASASRAIMDLLGTYDAGLTSEEIQSALRGRFQTSAEKPQRVITSTLSGLRANGLLIRDESGRYVLAGRSGRGEVAPLRDRMVHFFRERGNKPATTPEIAKATGTSTNAVRATFSGNRNLFAEVDGSAPNSFKLWRLIESTEGGQPDKEMT